MSSLFAGVAAFLLLQTQGESPRAVVFTAFHAVEGDSSAALERRWTSRVARDSGDRAARLGLATIARLTYRYRRADSLYLPLESGKDSYALYAALGRVWGDLFRAPFNTTAARALAIAAAARQLGDSSATAEALAVAGWLGSRLGAIGASLDSLTVAEGLAPPDQKWLKGLIVCTRAPIESFGGAGDAWATGQRGLALAKESGERRIIGFCYQSLSVVSLNVADDPGLHEHYADSAETLQLAARDSTMLSITTFNRGYGRWLYSDLAGARKALNQAIREGIASDCSFSIAWSYRWLSAVHWQAGDLAPTLRDFSLADSLFRRLNDGFGLANMRIGRAVGLLRAGRIDEAEKLYREGLEGSRARGIAEGVYGGMVNLAGVHSARGEWLAARDLIEKAIAYGNANGHTGSTSSLGYTLGIIALRLGELDKAERYFLASEKLASPTQFMDHFANQVRLAEVAARRGDLDQTVRKMESAARQLDSARSALQDEQLKLMVFQTRSTFDEPDLGLAPISELLIRGGHPADAFRLAEQRRARTLADRLLKDAFFRGSQVPRPESAGLPDLGELQSKIPAGTAVIEYLTGRNSQPTSAFILTSRSVRGVVLPPADSLAGDLDRFLAATEHGSAGQELGQKLSLLLWRPVLDSLAPEITSLIIVPDGRLHRVPFDALPLADGSPTLDRYIISRAPSAVIALQLLPRPEPEGPSRILALGDPRFAVEVRQDDPESEVYRSGYNETGGLARLTGSSDEARTVARYSPNSVVRLRDQATETYLKSPVVGSFQIIHLATHALVDDQSPGRSSLALTPGNGEDGFLGAAELSELKIGADLVVLSACRTAGGALIGGEGVQGLTAPLLAAGARAVIATLWPIGDQRTRALVKDLYDNLAAGQTVGEALRTAKVSARKRGESPAVWAAFTLVGDPNVRLKLVTPSPSRELWLAGVLALVAAVVLLARLRARLPRHESGS